MNFKAFFVSAAISLATFSAPALAADFSTVITDLNGKPLTGQSEGKTLTLGEVCANALLAQFPDETNLPGADKVKRFDLAMKVSTAKNVTLSAEDTALLKTVIAKGFGPLVVGRSWALLDPPSSAQ